MVKLEDCTRWDQRLSNLWQWTAKGKEHKNLDPSPNFRQVGTEGFAKQESATELLFFKELVHKH